MPNISHRPTDKTRSEVSALVSFGIPQDEIASYLGISKSTMTKHYNEELKLAAIKANAYIGKFLYSLASGVAVAHGASYSECSRAAMFWAKTRMGWRETDRLEHTGADGKPIAIAALDVSSLPTDVLNQIMKVKDASIGK